MVARHTFVTRYGRTAGLAGLVLGVLLFAGSAAVQPALAHSPESEPALEKYDAGWALYLDNDALLPATRDHDYTGGLALTLAGRRAQEWWISLDPALGWIDRAAGLERGLHGPYHQLHALQLSVLAFTPGVISERQPIHGDRPYASIVYLANSRTTVEAGGDSAYYTSFALGMLGLDIAKAVQRTLHHALGADEPEGWDGQISEGGEPTVRYTQTRLKLRAAGRLMDGASYDLKQSWAVSAGYITEANAALTVRLGVISTPWWSFTPERADYMTEPAPVLGGPGAVAAPREFFLWAGVKGRARVYNAFLQGQFRDSELTYGFDDTRPLIGEAWAGVTRQFGSGYRVSWAMRYQTSELRSGPGDRDLFWGGISISRSF